MTSGLVGGEQNMTFGKKWRLIFTVIGVLVVLAGGFFTLFIITVTGEKRDHPFLEKIFAPLIGPQTSILTVVVDAVSFGPPKWEYQLWFFPRILPKTIYAGSVLTITGTGIESASVTGDALKPEFGAWRVREIASSKVVFESTVEAKLTKKKKSFSGFSVTAPKAINGYVYWHSRGLASGLDSDTTSGPVGESGEGGIDY
jgi:hypothetical protein